MIASLEIIKSQGYN